MYFSRLILCALFAGLITGLILSVIHLFTVTPLIQAAEHYEIAEASDHGSHEHGDVTWSPEEGAERTFYTFASSVSGAIGFAAILLGLMSQLQLQGITKLSPVKGALWGLAGFIAFFAAPGIGLPPEIPGVEAVTVEHRQAWWLLTVIAVAIGICILAFSPLKFKAAGLISIALPYVIGAPQVDGVEFVHPDPAAIEALLELHQQFIVASSISNLCFWLVLGVACAIVLNKWVQTDAVLSDVNAR